MPNAWHLALVATVALPALGAPPPVFLEARIDPPDPWVQSQATYTLSFYQAIDLRDLRLEAPQMRLADVIPLDYSQREVQRDGLRYRLYESRFAVIPFASGRMELGRGHATANRPGDKQMRTWEAPSLHLDVRPTPAGQDATTWLPARSLELYDEWAALTGPTPAWRRTITLSGRGVLASQLPAVSLRVAGMQVTPLGSQRNTRVVDGEVLATSKQSYQLVGSGTGRVIVPELTLPWWKVGAGGTALARLPGRELDIGKIVGDRSKLGAGLDTLGNPSPSVSPRTTFPSGTLLLWLTLSCLLTVFVIWINRCEGPLALIHAWRIWRATLHGDTNLLQRHLLAWARWRWPMSPPLSLPQLAGRIGSNAGTTLLRLDSIRYGQREHPRPQISGKLVFATALSPRLGTGKPA